MLRKTPPKLLTELSSAAKNSSSPLIFYQTVRNNRGWNSTKGGWKSGNKTHDHLTYSRMGVTKIRKPIVDPELLSPGEPVTPSLMFGDMTQARRFEFNTASLNARGFLRFQKSYTPPADAAEKVLEICKSCMNSQKGDQLLLETEIKDSKLRFSVFNKLFEHFKHDVPNSMLHMMCTVGNLVDFYTTPIDTQTPYEQLARIPNLPPNLHIQKEPFRFHPDTDTLFGGETAFTKSSTIVTGLRAKKKYRGYEAKMTWP